MTQTSFDFALTAVTAAAVMPAALALNRPTSGSSAPGWWHRLPRVAPRRVPKGPDAGLPQFGHPATPSGHDDTVRVDEADASPEVMDFGQIGFEIGWDHAHHRIAPPIEHLSPGHPVRQGWEAGALSFGLRTLRASPWVRKWLNLRLNAFSRGLAFDALHITPHLLERLHGAASHCPVTRAPLTQGLGGADDATVDRVDNHLGYLPGNLAVMSRLANEAKGPIDFRGAIAQVERIEAERLGGIGGLSVSQWSRLAVLASFATPLPHDEAARLPLLVLPPARLRVVNPAQGVQVLLTTLLMQAGYARKLAEVAGRVASPAARQALQVFMHTLLARRVALGPQPDALGLKHGLEDAWRHPLVNQRWQAFALSMSAPSMERLLAASLQDRRGAGMRLVTSG